MTENGKTALEQAAPDLLASLQELYGIVPMLVRQLHYGAPVSVAEAHERAKKAIAKAEGY